MQMLRQSNQGLADFCLRISLKISKEKYDDKEGTTQMGYENRVRRPDTQEANTGTSEAL